MKRRIKISRFLALEASFNRVLKEERAGRKLVPDALSFCDYAFRKQDILQNITIFLDSATYSPKNLLMIDVPNDNFWIRPGSVPLFEDWVIYDAFAYYIGPKIDSKLKSRVFSNRFSRQNTLMPGVEQWKKFETAFWRVLQSSSNEAYVVITDITSYYTNINLDILHRHILSLLGTYTRTDEAIIDKLFFNLLIPWSQNPVRSGFGIPQGVDASSILANLYLHHVDDQFSRMSGVEYFRYADDIRMVAKDKITAKIALGRLIKALRDIGLDINTSKTKVLDKDLAIQQLPDPLSNDMDKANKLVRSKRASNVKLAIPILKKIFNYASSFKDDPLYQRHHSFIINRLILLRKYADGRFIGKVSKLFTTNLERLPGFSVDISRFFRYFHSKKIKTILISFLRGKDNIYGWQEMWILDCLIRFNTRSMIASDLDYFDDVSKDLRRHSLCRAKAILLLGKFGDQHRRSELMSRFNTESDPIVKRAIIIACQQLNLAERDPLYQIARADNSTSQTVSYVESLSRPKYCEEEEWAPFDIPDWGTY
ncbi:MAG: RNA-directed DNA polymerase [Dehalococcoidales bacterium]|nr:RNA-directed DNA polymerase [Dehalococcoidales bacterium]